MCHWHNSSVKEDCSMKRNIYVLPLPTLLKRSHSEFWSFDKCTWKASSCLWIISKKWWYVFLGNTWRSPNLTLRVRRKRSSSIILNLTINTINSCQELEWWVCWIWMWYTKPQLLHLNHQTLVVLHTLQIHHQCSKRHLPSSPLFQLKLMGWT